MEVFDLMTLALAWFSVSLCSANANLNTYSCPPYILIPENVTEAFTDVSRIRCAALVDLRNAITFNYQGTECILMGVGLGNHPPQEGDKKSQIKCTKQPPPEDLEEVATGKETYATPDNWGPQDKSKAVDGDRGTMYSSIPNVAKPWWIVDLGAVRTIYSITIVPRTVNNAERFHDIEIRCGLNLMTNGDLSSWTLLTFYKGPYSANLGLLTLYFQMTEARYISVQRIAPPNDYFHIVEFQVMAEKKLTTK